MSTRLEPAVWPPPRTGGEHATREWLDALASGHCDPDTFTRAMRDRFKANRNGNWEVLSLLDQYFRRGKLKADVFQMVKSRLEVSAHGANEKPPRDARAPAPRPAAVAQPSPAAQPSAAAQPSDAAQTGAAARPIHAAKLGTLPRPSAAPEPAVRETARAAARDVAVGDVLRGRYRIVADMGHGATGTIFEATDEYRLELPTTDLRVAIKVLHGAAEQREFQHLQLLSHANIVRVHEFDRDGDIEFYTMEFLSGAPLGQVLTARSGTVLPGPYALTIIRDVGDALSYAHSRGIVHGDLTPQDIFITNDGELRVFGFGASRRLLEGRTPDIRDDVFGFSCIAYLLMSGRHPFPQYTALEARLRRLRPRRPDGLSGQQWRALRAGLHWERDKRPSDVGEWLESFGVRAAAAHLPPLSAMVRTPPPRRRHLVLKIAAGALIALLLVAGYWAITDKESPSHAEAGWEARAKASLSGIGAALARLIPTRSLKPALTEPVPTVSEAPDATETGTAAPALATGGTALGSSVPPVSPPAPATRTSHAAPLPSATRVAAAPPAAGPSASTSAARDPSRGAATAGPARIEMAADTIDLPAGERTAHVIVRRKGNPRADSRFTWWTESGTAKPGVDFTAVAPHGEAFADGGGTLTLNVPVSDLPRSQPKSFYVVIGPAETGASLGPRTLTMVTILPPER